MKPKYQTNETELKKKVPDVSDLVKKAKLTELENEIPAVSSLAKKTVLTAVENKTSTVSSLVKKKTNYDTKITEFDKKFTDHNHEKYITTPEFNTLAADAFNAWLARGVNLITKTDFDAKLSSLTRKITSNKSKHLLVENEINQLKKLSLDCFLGRMIFDGEDGIQNYSVLQLINRYFKTISGVINIYYWQSKGLFDERINSIKTTNYSITPSLDYYGTRTRVEFNGSCLKQDKVTFNHGKVVNIYIVYEISKSINISDYPTLENSLFGAVTLTKNADIDK